MLTFDSATNIWDLGRRLAFSSVFGSLRLWLFCLIALGLWVYNRAKLPISFQGHKGRVKRGPESHRCFPGQTPPTPREPKASQEATPFKGPATPAATLRPEPSVMSDGGVKKASCSQRNPCSPLWVAIQLRASCFTPGFAGTLVSTGRLHWHPCKDTVLCNDGRQQWLDCV